MFIDKYTQVARILNPIVRVIDEVGPMCARDPGVRVRRRARVHGERGAKLPTTSRPNRPPLHPPHPQGYIDSTFGGVERCRKIILADFFRHGFDGSGADNFFDAGSCVRAALARAAGRGSLKRSWLPSNPFLPRPRSTDA